jgi:hypothetical protein
MAVDSLKSSTEGQAKLKAENHQIDSLSGDSSLAFIGKNFFQHTPSPFLRPFNTDSIRRSQVNAKIENLSTNAVKLKNIAVGGNTVKTKPDYKPSHFKGHLLQPVHNGPIIRTVGHENWQLVLILGVVFLIASLRLVYPKRFTMLWNAFRLKRFANQLFREENVLTQRISVLLFIIFLVSGSYFLFSSNEVLGYFIEKDQKILLFGKVLLFFTVFILSKFLIHSIFGFIFKTQKEMAEYLFNMSVIQQIGGIGLFILMVMQVLGAGIPTEIILWAGAATFIAMFGFQTYRGFSSALGTVSPVYFFLYFCALEILPLIWILKIVRG